MKTLFVLLSTVVVASVATVVLVKKNPELLDSVNTLLKDLKKDSKKVKNEALRQFDEFMEESSKFRESIRKEYIERLATANQVINDLKSGSKKVVENVKSTKEEVANSVKSA